MFLHSSLTEFPRHLSIHLGIVENTDDSYDCGDTLNTNERKVIILWKINLIEEGCVPKGFSNESSISY